MLAPDAGISESAAEFQAWLGEVTVAETVPHLLRFMEEGGTLITIGTSTSVRRATRTASMKSRPSRAASTASIVHSAGSS